QIDIYMYSKRCSLDIILDAAMGGDFGIQRNTDHPYPRAVETFTNISQRYIVEPHLWSTVVWYLFHHREYKAALNQLHRLTSDLMDVRMKRMKSGDVDLAAKRKPIIDHFLTLHLQGKITLE
ncbi:hypothetical protein PMAYCL1PPCAC_03253, partial [Pristionchus mayeri]